MLFSQSCRRILWSEDNRNMDLVIAKFTNHNSIYFVSSGECNWEYVSISRDTLRMQRRINIGPFDYDSFYGIGPLKEYIIADSVIYSSIKNDSCHYDRFNYHDLVSNYPLLSCQDGNNPIVTQFYPLSHKMYVDSINGLKYFKFYLDGHYYFSKDSIMRIKSGLLSAEDSFKHSNLTYKFHPILGSVNSIDSIKFIKGDKKTLEYYERKLGF